MTNKEKQQESTKQDKIYVQGGVYSTLKQFALVRPIKGLPYIWKDPKRAQRLTRHHSHTYLVGNDLKTLTLYQKSWECEGVKAPQKVTLDDDLATALKQSIDHNVFYD